MNTRIPGSLWLAFLGGVLLAVGAGGGAAADDAPPPAAAFARLPDLTMARLTPDGTKVAWAGYRDGHGLVSIFDLAARKYVRQIQPGEDLRLRDLTWADDRTLLLTLSRTNTFRSDAAAHRKYEYFRIIAVDSVDGSSRVLLMNDPSRQSVTGATLLRTQTGRAETVIMSSWDFYLTAYKEEIGTRIARGREGEGWMYSVFEVNTRSGKGKRLHAGTAFTLDWIVDAQGQPVARSEWNPANRDFRVLASTQGRWQEIYAAQDPYGLQPSGLTADGHALIALGSRGGNRVRAWRMPLDGSEVSLLFEGDEDVEGVVVDRFTGAPVGLHLGGLEPRVQWLDERFQTMQTRISRAFPRNLVSIYDHSKDHARVLARVEGASRPPVYYLVDLARNTAEMIGEAYPELNGATLGSQRAMRYPARDGATIPAYLILPPGREPKGLPLVVLPHGGPQARDYGDFDWWAQFIASRGYAVLQPQFRGSTGFGADLERAGRREWGRAMQDDVIDGVQSLIDQGTVDGARVCIVGASYGGYVALAGAAFASQRFVCAASINGIANLPGMLGYIQRRHGEESDALAAWHELVGLPYENQLDAASPAHAVRDIRIPVLLVHGLDDTVVPFAQSEGFARLLKEHDKPHTLVTLKGEDHWLSTSEARLEAMQALEVFLATHLPARIP